jgi:hypothetical protein
MRSSDVPYEIVDNNLISKESCNYKLTIKKVGLDLPTVPVWQPLYISFPIHGLQSYKKKLSNTREKTKYERLIEGFIPYPEESTEPMFDLANLSWEEDSAYIRFPVSDINVYYNELNSDTFDYLFYLDEITISSKYPNVHTHKELKSMIANQAVNDLRKSMKKTLEQNYHNIPYIVNSILISLMNIDFTELISMKPMNESACQKALKALNLDPDEIFTIIDDKKMQSSALLCVYHSIQGFIADFFKNLQLSGLHFALKAHEHLNTKELNKHIEIVRSFIMSDNLAKAIFLQENPIQTTVTENSEISVHDNLGITEDNHRYNELFLWGETVIMQYWNQLLNPNPLLDIYSRDNFFISDDPDAPLYPLQSSDHFH